MASCWQPCELLDFIMIGFGQIIAALCHIINEMPVGYSYFLMIIIKHD
jgi:hypothetical protein